MIMFNVIIKFLIELNWVKLSDGIQKIYVFIYIYT
jgi:hypothetical protein